MENIAVYLDTIDPIFLPEKYRKECYVIVAKDTPLHTFAKNYFSDEKILAVTLHDNKGNDLSESKVFYSKAFINAIRAKKIKHIVTPVRCTQLMEKWGKEQHITFIGPSRTLQQELENKLEFDKLLKKEKILSPKTISTTNTKVIQSEGPFVVQQIESSGLEGTHFYKNLNEVKLNAKKKILIREYIDGIPIGVSVLFDALGNYYFSACRRQCFLYKNGFPDQFLGIQWIPTDFFDKKANESIYATLDRLAKVLQIKGFKGIANIDLLIKNNTAYVIECNPRLSAATAQFFSIPEVSEVADSYGVFINSFVKNSKITYKKCPLSSKYEGSILYVNVKGRKKVKNLPQVGIYNTKNKIKYISANFNKLKDDKIFMMHYLQKKGIYKDIEMSAIVVQKALFDIKTGTLNKEGERIFNFFANEFFGK